MSSWMIDVEMVLMYLALLAAVGVSVWSAWRSVRMRGKSTGIVNNIPVARIAYGSAALLLVSLVLTFLLGSSEPMMINGVRYAETFWLKVSDMFIITATVLFVVAAMAAVFGMSGYNRKLK